MCRIVSKVLTVCWSSLQGTPKFKQYVSGSCGQVFFCADHKCVVDGLNCCPMKSDELTTSQQLYLEKWMAEEALELEIVAK